MGRGQEFVESFRDGWCCAAVWFGADHVSRLDGLGDR